MQTLGLRAWSADRAFTVLVLGLVVTLAAWAVLGWLVFGSWYPNNGTVTLRLTVMRGTATEETLRKLAQLPEGQRKLVLRNAFWEAYAAAVRDSVPFELLPIEVDESDFVDSTQATTLPSARRRDL